MSKHTCIIILGAQYYKKIIKLLSLMLYKLISIFNIRIIIKASTELNEDFFDSIIRFILSSREETKRTLKSEHL